MQDVPDEGAPEWWLHPAQCRWWLCLHLDWKTYDEAAWQIQAICHTLGLETGFVSEAEAQWNSYFGEMDRLRSRQADSSPVSHVSLPDRLRAALQAARQAPAVTRPRPLAPSDTPTLDVLEDASAWLRRQGYELLHLNTGSDEYLAVPIRLGLLTEARTVAERLNISTFLV